MAKTNPNAKVLKDGTQGRPPIILDWLSIGVHATYQCSHEELAAVAGCSVRTLYNRCPEDNDGLDFAGFVALHRDKGNAEVRTRLFDLAVKSKDPRVLIHYAKNHLGHTEKVEHSGAVTYAQIAASIPKDEE